MKPDYEIVGLELLGELGRGAVGVVYKARQTTLNRTVAVKVLIAGDHADTLAIQRMQNEAETVAGLQHPNIVQIYEFGTLDGKPCYVLEYAANGNLKQHLGDRMLPFDESAKLVETLAYTMQATHDKGVIHRDLKPANVLMAADGTPKIGDFGLAKRLDDVTHLTASGAIMGTPSYMAPEQAVGSKDVGPAADVYSLGVMLYELLTGNVPFRGKDLYETLEQVVKEEPVPPRQRNPKVPRDLETICLKCLKKEPAKRYASAKALAEDLHRFRHGEAIVAKPPSQFQKWKSLYKRYPRTANTLLVLTVANLVFIAGLLIYLSMNRQRELTDARQRVGELLKRVDSSDDMEAERLYDNAQEEAFKVWSRQQGNEEAIELRYSVLKSRCEWYIAQKRYAAARSLLQGLREADRYKARGDEINTLQERIEGSATLTVAADPPEARLRIARVIDGKTEEQQSIDPLGIVKLEPGSYLLIAAAADAPEVRVPLSLERHATLTLPLKIPKANEYPKGMVYIPAGPALLADPKTGRDRVVNVPGFFIDRTEVTNKQYEAFVKATMHPPPDSWGGPFCPAGREEEAVHNVSWYDARAYAKWAGKRLPTGEEWEKAARGADGRTYPWGNSFEAQRCNNREVKALMTVDRHRSGESIYGVQDMAGNVWEWTLDRERSNSAFRCFRGGAAYSDAAELASARRQGGPPGGSDYGASNLLGFRCVKPMENHKIDPTETGPDLAAAAEYEAANGNDVTKIAEALLELNPNSVAGLYWQGRMIKRVDPARAAELWAKAFRRDPKFLPNALVYRHFKFEEEIEARKIGEECRKEIVHISKLIDRGEFGEAQAELLAILKSDGDYRPALEFMIEVQHIIGSLGRDPKRPIPPNFDISSMRAKVLELYRAELREFPEDAERHAEAAEFVLANKHDVEIAIAWLKKAIELAPHDCDSRLLFGKALATAGRWTEAAEQAAVAKKLLPENDEAQRAERAYREKRLP